MLNKIIKKTDGLFMKTKAKFLVESNMLDEIKPRRKSLPNNT